MNTIYTDNIKRRDELMRAARTLKHTKYPSPGTVAVYQDCVKHARFHNHLALMYRPKQEQ